MFSIAEDGNPEKIRIGTYDSRAIAIAYAPSKFNPVKANMEKYNVAKIAGDKKKMKELEAWGEKHQRQLHRQGFSNLPVHDLLSHVKDQLPTVAKEAGVIAIVAKCDFTSETVEVVDVTERLVELFDPSEKTLKYVREIKNVKPIDIDELDDTHKDD
jgi:hypothetical protein